MSGDVDKKQMAHGSSREILFASDKLGIPSET